MSDSDTRESVRRRYAEAARAMAEKDDDDDDGAGMAACCVPPVGPRGPRGSAAEETAEAAPAGQGDDAADAAGCCAPDALRGDDPITAGLYHEDDLAGLPEKLVGGSLGCGNPTALAELHEGETVLDLGSGAGLDVLLSARRVGPTGMAYGVDMTDEMLEEARSNAREADVDNVEFLRGEIEDLPLPDASVDVVISNCVINLSTDKRRVIEEAHRVLRPGGRFAVADVVVRGPVPDAARRSMELWVGCVAGALEEETYRRLLAETGFGEVGIEITRVYDPEDAQDFLAGEGLEADEAVAALEDGFAAAFVRARKPARPEAATGRPSPGAPS